MTRQGSNFCGAGEGWITACAGIPQGRPAGVTLHPCNPHHIGMASQPVPIERQLADAINALNCEYVASYEYPGHTKVYPQTGTMGADSVDALRWAWGFEGDLCLGNDCHVQREARTIPCGGGSIATLAQNIVDLMRVAALQRCSYLNDLCERMAGQLEALTEFSEWRKLVNEWRQH